MIGFYPGSRFGVVAGTTVALIALAACTNEAPTSTATTAAVIAPSGPPSTETVLAQADPDMKKVLDALQGFGGKPLETLTPAEARLQPTLGDAVKAVMQQAGQNSAPEPVASTKDVKLPGPGGQMVRIYTPKGRGPFPVVVFYHGGGFVIADINTYDSSARAIANAAQAVVVSAEYRHAPEAKFPAAHDDAFTAYKWALEHARTFQGDPNRVAVAGESAGGNLAIAVSLMAREAKVKLPVYEVAIYPVAGTDMNTPSYVANTNAVPLNKAAMGWFVDKYITGPKDLQNPLINLDGTADLAGLEPTLIVTDQIDPLMSEGKMLADKMQAAGVKVTYQNYNGVTHEFFGAGATIAKSKMAQAFVGDQLKDAFKPVVVAKPAPARAKPAPAKKKPA